MKLFVEYISEYIRRFNMKFRGDKCVLQYLNIDVSYSLDAPEIIPAGSTVGDEMNGYHFPSPSFITRD